jgi:NAD(P)-dependent dehydrogenase (short-subunit alcohol dehydrogenase family)
MGNFDRLGYRDKTVVVTGASSGMGEATARILGELGARVYVVDNKAPEEVLPAMEDRGGIAVIASVAGMSWRKNLAQNLWSANMTGSTLK